MSNEQTHKKQERAQNNNVDTTVEHYGQKAIAISEEIDVKPFQTTGLWSHWKLNAARIEADVQMTKQVAQFQSQQLEHAHKFLLELQEVFLKGKLIELTTPIRLHAKKLLDNYEIQINKSTQDHLKQLDDNLVGALETLKGSALPEDIKQRRLEDTVVDYFVAVENIRKHKL